MKQTVNGMVIVIAVVVAGLALVAGGIGLGRSGVAWAEVQQATNVSTANAQMKTGPVYDGRGMMGSDMMGVGYANGYSGTMPYGFGMMMDGASGVGSMGMMNMMGGNMMGNSFGSGMIGMGMMGNLGPSALYGVEPPTLSEVEDAVKDYLARMDDQDLELDEVMIFDNHAYVQVVEKSTGIGAFELLVDPVTLAVSPEPGPNMMWNTKYSPMSGFGGMGMMGMMGGFDFQDQQNMMGSGEMMGDVSAPETLSEMPVSAEEAVDAAQRYLDAYLPGAETEGEADTFYGYYTLHILRDGRTVGMLSVNGYSRQVFVHTWHGNLIGEG